MKYVFLFTILFYCTALSCQKVSPVQWSFSTQIDNNGYTQIVALASLKKGWYIYSQHTNDEGPIPTAFTVGDNQIVFEEKGELIAQYDEMFEVEVKKYKDTVTFLYTLNKSDSPSVISGDVFYMCCDDTQCLPPIKVDFKLPNK